MGTSRSFVFWVSEVRGPTRRTGGAVVAERTKGEGPRKRKTSTVRAYD